MFMTALTLLLFGFVGVKETKWAKFSLEREVAPCLSFSPDGNVLLFNGMVEESESTRVYALLIDSLKLQVSKNISGIRCFCLSQDGRLLATASTDEKSLEITDMWSDSSWRIPFERSESVEHMEFLDDSTLLVSGSDGIWLVKTTDGTARLLCDGCIGISIDSNRLAVSVDQGNGFDIYKMDIEGSPEPIFADVPEFGSYGDQFVVAALTQGDSSYSPDGRFAAFEFDGDIYLADRQTGDIRRLTHSSAREHSPAFSIDGLWIAYIRDLGAVQQLRKVSIDGLVDEPIPLPNDFVACASPDGRYVAFIRTKGQNLDGGELYLLDLQSGDTTSLGIDKVVRAAWSPEGDRLAVAVLERDRFKIGILKIEGRGIVHRPVELAVDTRADTIRGTRSRTSTRMSPASKPRLIVLAIGISKYKNRQQTLNFASSDARSFAEVLRAQGKSLFSKIIVKTLVDADATRANVIDRGLEWIARRARKGDVAVIFVAGHGIRDPSSDDYYFLAYDSNFSDFTSSAVLWAYFNKAIRKMRRKGVDKIVLFFDTCHSGAFEMTGLRGDESTRGADLGKLFAESEGLWVFSSSKNDETSIESEDFRLRNDPIRAKGHGLFTFAILDGLLNGHADFNGDRIITTSELATYVSSVVPDTAAEYDMSQHPFVKGSGTEIPIYKVR